MNKIIMIKTKIVPFIISIPIVSSSLWRWVGPGGVLATCPDNGPAALIPSRTRQAPLIEINAKKIVPNED